MPHGLWPYTLLPRPYIVLLRRTGRSKSITHRETRRVCRPTPPTISPAFDMIWAKYHLCFQVRPQFSRHAILRHINIGRRAKPLARSSLLHESSANSTPKGLSMPLHRQDALTQAPSFFSKLRQQRDRHRYRFCTSEYVRYAMPPRDYRQPPRMVPCFPPGRRAFYFITPHHL